MRRVAFSMPFVHTVLAAAATLVALIPLGLSLPRLAAAQNAPYLYIGDYPNNGTPSWGDNDALTNGIAHDADNWYITAIATDILGFPDNKWIIWRIPVSEPLDQDFSANPTVRRVRLGDVPPLASRRYGHAGDLDCYRHAGVDYLVVPLTGYGLLDGEGRAVPNSTPAPAIAVFRADDLSLVSVDSLSEQGDVGWCAVDPAGYLYTSSDETTRILRYEVSWDNLREGTGFLKYKDAHTLKDFGGQQLRLYNMQGGEFTLGAERLIVSCGIFVSMDPTDGIHVFDTRTWQEVARSTNGASWFPCCPAYFRYDFNNSFEGGDEPEGLTVWDVEDGRAPNIRGQLHVILYIHNYLQSNTVKLKHYSGRIHADAGAGPPPLKAEYDGGFPLPGTMTRPFDTLGNAMSWYRIWDGAEIVMRAGRYPERGTYSGGEGRRIRITARGGEASVGR